MRLFAFEGLVTMADESRYSVAYVARLLLLASELYQQTHSAKTQAYDPAALCPHGKLFYDYKANGRRGRACRTCASEIHATLVGRPNLSESQRASYLDALIDLDVAMNTLDRRTRMGVGRYIETGPEHYDDRCVTFRYGQAHYVTVVTKTMNGDV